MYFSFVTVWEAFDQSSQLAAPAAWHLPSESQRTTNRQKGSGGTRHYFHVVMVEELAHGWAGITMYDIGMQSPVTLTDFGSGWAKE
ncbi:hypothetical protein FQN53_005148 [Emmonsiellopsis sp. PD_33]|nr:hypothetical protein FQN53_005148 [Emmonsiellopsis sp. PD_33]